MKKKDNDKSARALALEALLLIPNFLKLLYRLIADPRVLGREKAVFLGTVAYVLSPLDFLPDAIPFLGQIDDLLLVALVLKRFMNSIDRRVIMEYWDGREDLLLLIDRILEFTRYLLPEGIYAKVVNKSHADYIDAEYEVK